MSNRCGTTQRVSVRVAKVSLHSYFPPPQLAARCECETKWYHAAMQLNDWSPTCTLHSRVTSCINNGLSSIQIVRVCNVQSPFCKMSLRYCWVLDVTNHLAIKLENFHKSWYFLDTSFHEYNYQSSTATTNYQRLLLLTNMSYPRYWRRCQGMQAQTHLHMGQGPQHFLGLGCPCHNDRWIVGSFGNFRSIAAKCFSYEINRLAVFCDTSPGVSLELGYHKSCI